MFRLIKRLLDRAVSRAGGVTNNATLSNDLQMAMRYGNDWYERAVWQCECGDTWRVNDMYEWSGVCPYCGNEPELRTDLLDVPF